MTIIEGMNRLVDGIAAVLEVGPEERTKVVMREVYRLVVDDRKRVAEAGTARLTRKGQIATRQVDYRG